MLQKYKKKYRTNNFQFVLIDNSGCVLESDNTIFTAKKNNKLQNIHPFFELLSTLFKKDEDRFEFSCINLVLDEKTIITNIVISKENTNENLVIIEDLTQHYNNYQVIAQTKNESIINAQILELKNTYLLEKETYKNNFIANFSHQLRNPITASLIFSDLLINSDLNPEQKNYLDIIVSANKDLKNRVEDILDISKINSGKLILADKVFDLEKLLNTVALGYSVLAEKKGITFNFNFDKKLPQFIKGDQYRLKQIIGNLLNNAISYTSQGFINLDISLNYIRAKKINLRIEVADTGCGINPEHIETIFERFTTIETTNKNKKNTGLGLAIVKYLVSEIKGNIKVESKINKGSTFICNLSFKTSDYNQILKQELLKKQLPNLDKKHHILLVEDSELIQLTILKTLAATGDFYLNIISKGEDLIPSIINKDIDLILLANTIHGFSAIDLAASVRNLPKAFKKTPIIVLSTQAYKEDHKHYKKHGINDVVVKPFDKKNLLEKIYVCIK